MEWQDEGIILGAKKYGESSHIVTIFTPNNGKTAGLVKSSGSSGKKGNILQLGNLVSIRWRSRLENNLGNFNLELIESYSFKLLDDPIKLSTLSSACALIEKTLPERESYQDLYFEFKNFFQTISCDDWAKRYVEWEVLLLETLGYGLDLSCCAATGVTNNLIYVSPKSGCAVCEEAGRSYQNRLLPLPLFLIKKDIQDVTKDDIAKGLKLTEYFLRRHVFNNDNIKIPFARNRLAGFFIGNSNE
ncbi:MAG: DNA repair protein RecO [Alphaproteobacteria bacterium]